MRYKVLLEPLDTVLVAWEMLFTQQMPSRLGTCNQGFFFVLARRTMSEFWLLSKKIAHYFCAILVLLAESCWTHEVAHENSFIIKMEKGNLHLSLPKAVSLF